MENRETTPIFRLARAAVSQGAHRSSHDHRDGLGPIRSLLNDGANPFP